MSRAGNGLTVEENLTHQRMKPAFKEPTPIPYSEKCSTHPTKRAWAVPAEAVREAEARTRSSKIHIVAYRCDDCGNAHLCKADHMVNIKGTVLEREIPERNWEVFPRVGGNADARLKILAEFLDGRESVTTAEVVEAMEWHRKTVSDHMRTLGWRANRGPGARWFPGPAAPALRAVEKPVETETPIDLARRRHPAAQNVGWRAITTTDRIRHMPIGDLIDTLEAVGLELRLMTRERES